MEGQSWSGHELNCAYLNCRDGTFADVSAVSGLDFDDDGRALALSDWDGDGDLDLWLKNRTGPQLRFVRNDGSPGHHFFQIKLAGKTCNRDAIGAKVELKLPGRTLTKFVTAGDGNLAQSSKWLHFGLGDADKIDQLLVRWPDGSRQELAGPQVDRRYRLLQGQDSLETVPNRSISLPDVQPPAEPEPPGSRVILRSPLPLPPSVRSLAEGRTSGGRSRLVTLWAIWCPECRKELSDWAERPELFEKAGVDVIALNIDRPQDHQQAFDTFEGWMSSDIAKRAIHLEYADPGLMDTIAIVLQEVRGKPSGWPLPTSLLIDPQGRLQVLYLGRVTPDDLTADLHRYCGGDLHPDQRALYPGRWANQLQRSRPLPALADEFLRRGRPDDAAFYARR